MKYFTCLLAILLWMNRVSAADLAPISISNMICDVNYTGGVVSPALTQLYASTGLVYGVSAASGSTPLSTGAPYAWIKTGVNTGTIFRGNGPNRAETLVTFTSVSEGTFRDRFGVGTIFFRPVKLDSVAPLRNLSCRALLVVNQPLNVGFVVAGAAPRRVLVRAIGPSLAAFEVGKPAPNPVLTVLSNGAVVGTNSGWGGSAALAATFASVGAFALPAGSRDSAMVLALDAGDYTLQARDAVGGEVLVEVYFTN